MSDREEIVLMWDEGIKESDCEKQETIRLFLIEEEYENSIASVSIGHIDYRATFYFESNADAIACYDILKRAIDMDID